MIMVMTPTPDAIVAGTHRAGSTSESYTFTLNGNLTMIADFR